MSYIGAFAAGILFAVVGLLGMTFLLREKIAHFPEKYRNLLAWTIIRPIVEMFPNGAEANVINMTLTIELAKLPKWRLLMLVASNSADVTRYGLLQDLKIRYSIACTSISMGVNPADA